ncbi:uncharacterized protein NDAI_0G00100 [Naumovozyma dairenensis CBS 421]|uniref:Uncharacterized protein n=1 Tax=Naumovozyma dairenensis (strain ATCC 10597 / BCRC 20456 / CBS 421 / NBRC 0211 / NRRL Y-12639) TaxID=1071378 RepID=G0WDC5_NAUDC|nr:hypothetical protein NDAI_0G00100 [Naumovozyma dairenensis CBS 421]CCD25786.2 hypothetical protein NDAI_0G00100 [Naumovozyma dairenensis CBS 421]
MPSLQVFFAYASFVQAAFPFYDEIRLGLHAAYWYFEPESPVLTDLAFWGSFAEGSITSVREIMNTCRVCEQDDKEPNWDCRDSALALVKTLVMNVITICVGWKHAGRPNGSMEGADTTAIAKRDLSNLCSADSGDFVQDCVDVWLTDYLNTNYPEHWSVIGNSLVKRDENIGGIHVKNHNDSMVYHLLFKPNTVGNGAVAMKPLYREQSGNLTKRDYPLYAPSCSSYLVADYCANQSKWGGVYDSGEMENMLNEIYTNDFDGTWTADYYKLYTKEQDDKTQDWELSWRTYEAKVGNSIYWSQCDTGH